MSYVSDLLYWIAGWCTLAAVVCLALVLYLGFAIWIGKMMARGNEEPKPHLDIRV